MLCVIFCSLRWFVPRLVWQRIYVGIGKAAITPSIGTPSAGYTERKGEGMLGIHDPLLAIALYIDNGEKKIILCSVDHLGFTYEKVQEVTQKVRSHPALIECEVTLHHPTLTRVEALT